MSRYAVAKPYVLPALIDLLAGPTTGTVVLPRHINWGPHYAYDLADHADLGPVLHRDDVAAGKTGALFSRAEARDAIDVDGLLKAGYSRLRLIELAAQNDASFDERLFADALRRVARYSDKQFAAYGLDPAAAAAIREQFADWHQELTGP